MNMPQRKRVSSLKALALACLSPTLAWHAAHLRAEPSANHKAKPLANPATKPSLAQKPISFAFIGDVPYNTLEETALRRIYQTFPKDIAFALHIGDIKSGSEECSDALITRRFDLLQTSPAPLVLLPGDNEWVDCARSVAGSFDPIERLKFWRELEARDRRADRALRISRQPLWPELVMWSMPEASASFVGLNIPGSYDALVNNPTAREHRRLRNAANFDWLELAGNRAQADGDKFLFVAIHANVKLETGRPEDAPSPTGGIGNGGVGNGGVGNGATGNGGSGNGSSGSGASAGSSSAKPYQPFKQALSRLLSRYSGQVIVLYGDTHEHRIDYPWEESVGKRLMAVQCVGSPFNGSWLRIDVDPQQARPKITSQAVL
jgi:hypothetical protein